jgi:hypothetical protein
MVKLIASEIKVLEDGLHQGNISKVEIRDTKQGYKYLDVYIQSKGIEVKCSYTTNWLPENKTGQMLARFGKTWSKDQELDLDFMVGLPVNFVTIKVGKFTNVQADTLKPAGA